MLKTNDQLSIRRHATKFLSQSPGHGVGWFCYDHRCLVHCQPGRFPRLGEAKNQIERYQRCQGMFSLTELPFLGMTKVFSVRLHLQLRNTMENLTCATVKGSAVDMYFRRQVELSNMYRTMEANNYDTAEEAINDVKNG